MENKTIRQLKKESKRLIPLDRGEVINKYLDKIKEFNPDKICFLVSTGDDSLASYLFTRDYLLDYEKEVLHIDTKTGIYQDQENLNDKRRYATVFLEKLCKKTGDKFIVKSSTNEKDQYLHKIQKYGLPNNQVHLEFYVSLKERCFRDYVRENPKKRILFVVGVRADESPKRRKQINDKGSWQPKTKKEIWFASISNWFKSDCMKYINEVYKRSDVAIKLGSSGECLCGATAHRDEMIVIQKHYPRNFKEIIYWEDLVQRIYGKGDEVKSYWGNSCKDFKEQLKVKFGKQTDLSSLCGNGNCKLIKNDN